MNKRRLIFFLITLHATFYLHAQHVDPVAIKIDGKPVLKSELEKAYRESNASRPDGEKESLADFVQSYIDFRLNIAEAKAQRIDTTGNYIRDLSAARVGMSRKYMQDTIYENDYLLKIYNRMQQNVEINHVLVPFEEKIIYPADTVVLYQKAIELQRRLSKNGFAAEGYNKVLLSSTVLDYNQQNGYIGWVAPFMFNAKVEEAIYYLPVNEVSMPIRCSDGYHIIQVLNKRPAVGSLDIEQVLFNFSRIPADLNQIDSVGKVAWREYRNMRTASDYQSLCDEFTRVMQMGEKGCHFGVLNLESRLSATFIEAAFNLKKEGDVSEPVQSEYGFHIIRLLKKIPVPSYADMKSSLKARILESDKSEEMTIEKRKRMSQELGFNFNRVAYDRLNEIANKISPKDSSFLKNVDNNNDILFSFGDKKIYTVANFVEYIRLRQNLMDNKPTDAPETVVYTEAINNSLSTDVLKEYFKAYYSRCLTDYYYLSLPDREPEYKNRLDEISNGLLSFGVMNKNIWGRAATDKKGLSEYFKKNKSKYSLGGTKYRGLIVYAKDEKALTVATSLSKREKNRDVLIEKIRHTLNKDSLRVLMEPGIWAKGENPYVDNKVFEGKEVKAKMGYPYFIVLGDFVSKPIDYNDVRHAVESGYQAQLEQQWKADLRKKYKVEINNSVLNTIK